LLAKRKEKVLRKWTNQFFYSKKIGIKGEVDLIVETENGIKVIEIKNTSWKKLRAGDLYQTAAYALLVEENFNSIVKSLIIYYLKSDKIFEINFSDELRDHVKWIIKKINKIIENEEMPKIKKIKECKGCGYYSFCRGL
jgi:CRISPR-associated exonuclease Cas4